MLSRIDRVQLAVPDASAAASGWVTLLGAEHDEDDRLPSLAAKRSRYRLGDGWIELLEPDGAGPVADAVSERRGHLFAAGASTPDPEALLARLREHGVEPLQEGGQLHLDPAQTGGHGLRLVVSPDELLHHVGAVDMLYEVTNLVHDAKATVERCALLFGLDAGAFVPIDSPHYGYDGTLTLFDPERLHRFEMITPHIPENTMGRFFGRFGESLYMAFAETGELATILERAREHGADHTEEPPQEKREGRGPDTVFLHPKALGGMMLGLSRRTWAWRWSGYPERVEKNR